MTHSLLQHAASRGWSIWLFRKGPRLPIQTSMHASLASALWRASLFLKSPVGTLEHPDEHVVAACTHNRLEKLTLEDVRSLTRNVVDGIISSQSAATLRELDIKFCEAINDAVSPDFIIRAIDILRLVRNLPTLTELRWQRAYFPARVGPRDLASERAIEEVLVGRGGNFWQKIDIYE